MRNAAHSDESRMEMLQLSNYAKTKFRSDNMSVVTQTDRYFARNIADLVLIAMSKNQQHVKAVAANSRKAAQKSTRNDVADKDGDVEQANGS